MTKDEALLIALERLEYWYDHADILDDGQAITAIKEALAQPEQKPAIGDIRALKHRIHELEGEVIGYKQILDAEQEPVAWKPDRSGKYLTVVYRDLIPGDEVGAIVEHPKCAIMSWSNAIDDVEQLRNTTPPQRKPLTDEQIRKAKHHMVEGAYDYSFKQGVKWAEYKHGIEE